jgi:uncharacterized repeat protein (TIGR03803 family)
LCLLVASLWPLQPAATAQEAGAERADPPGLTTLHRFRGARNAEWPRGGVGLDAAGNLYGTTLYEGHCSTCGVLYTLKRPAAGETIWAFKVLHEFGKTLQDGIGPTAPVLIRDNVIYSTTSAGADPSCGCGETFSNTVPTAAKPVGTYRLLHRFSVRAKGSTPIAGLLIDSNDTVYGTTSAGGKNGAGTVFKHNLDGSGFTLLHDFVGNFNGGPQGELVFGKDGAIYGTTFGGGRFNQGTIFRITKAGAFSVLYHFKGVNQPGGSTDGAQPEGRLAVGPDGTIYGTTAFGGSPSGYGTAWSLTPVEQARATEWRYRQLHIFGSNGNIPHSGLVRAANGVLYGTGAGGGRFDGGAIYSLTPPASGKKWKYTLLHSFRPRHKDGDIPYGAIVLKAGALYGSNISGGQVGSPNCFDGCGTVFKFKL